MSKFLSALCVSIFLLFVSCQKDSVKLTGKNFESEVPTVGNLVFNFDRTIAPDSVLDFWDTTAYITFEPKIEGRFKWTTQTELVFSPYNELPASTEFHATLNKTITKFTKCKLKGETELNFHTPFLNLTRTHAFWTVNGEDYEHPMAQIDLEFNYIVDPNEVAKKLKVEAAGISQSFNLITTEPSNLISVTLLKVQKEDKDKTIKSFIGKGLKIYRSESSTKNDIKDETILISPYKLEVTNIEREHDGVEGRIMIYTSQQTKAQDLESYIELKPSVKFKTLIEQDHFTIYSEEFKPNEVYNMTIKKGLRGVIGGLLKENYESQVSFGELEPSIDITNAKGFYLSGKGYKNLAVNIVNVAKVKVVISKIYENNLLSADRYTPDNNDNEAYYSDESEAYYDDYYGQDVMAGDIIFEKVYTTKELPKLGNVRLLNVNFQDKLPTFKGVYHIQISSEEDNYVRATRILSISDIGLIAKKGKDKMYVLTNSISSTSPLAGVEITVIGKNNQIIGKGRSNGEGFAEVTLINTTVKGFYPTMITAKLGDDFTYLPFNKTFVNTSRFDVGGITENPAGLQCFIYPERDMYRPGETVKLATIIRNAQWLIPAAIPVKVKILLPNGNEYKLLKKSLNEQGSFDASFDLPAAAVTGNYSVEVYTSNDVLLGSLSLMIEEFMPDRIKVSTTTNKKVLGPSESLNVTINAMNYFGPPAANNDYQVEFRLNRAYVYSKKFPSFSFEQSNNNTYFSADNREGKTDEKGNGVESFSLPAEYINMGKLSLDVFTTVFDENGRSVNRKDLIDIYTQDIFYGIGDFSYWNGLNTPLDIPLIAIDKNDNAINGVKTKVQIIRYDYKTVLSQNGSYYSYNSEKQTVILETKDMTLNATNNRYHFVPRTSGEYEIRVYKPGVNNYVSRTFYAYGWGNNYNSNFEVNNEGNVDIQLDKEKYLVGETANILFKTPFAGKLMVTIETNEVLDHFILDTDKKSASMKLKITEKYQPNVYISATLIKPHGSSELPLTVAHGIQPLMVDNPSTKINMSIIAQKSVRSRTKQKINVKGAPNSYVTIAAVDEGILAMTNFQTPDPFQFFYAKRALSIKSFDMYPFLLEELSLSKSSSGGDGYDLSKRVNPLTNKRVKLVSFWSGLIKTDGSGNASMTIDIPQFSGQLRIMTANHFNNKFGMAQMTMTVADPVVISSGLPRFFSPGDTVDMPVNLSNTTSKALSAKAIVSVSGPLKVVGPNTQTISLKANGENVANFKVYAVNSLGVGKIHVDVNAGAETYTDETDITIRPASSLQKVNGSGSINAGSNQSVSLNTTGFMLGSIGGKIVISKSPLVQWTNHLDYLVQYPYGCAEQTVSTAFPQIYYGDMCLNMYSMTNKKLNPNANIEEALKKLKLCQIYNGGITMWSGGGEENWWVTAYVAHFMIECKKAGFEIDEGMLDRLFGYLKMKLKSRETISYYYNRDLNKKIAPKEVAYSLYVLALGGKPENSTMSYYKSNPQLLSLDSKYLMAAAYYMAGDKTKYREILPTSFTGEESVTQNGGSFYSAIRDQAIALNALIDINPDDPQVAIISKMLSTQLKNNRYLNTQERVFSFLALGKIAKLANKNVVTAEVISGGKNIASYKEGMITINANQLTANTAQIVVKGTGKLYYFWEAEGISSSGAYTQEDKFLQVRKTFYDRYGRQINDMSFKQNDLVVIKLSLKSSAGFVENVVITDLLPAGFEIENPRINDLPGTSWVKDNAYPDHSDIRDDRINLFVSASPNVQNYYYVVRCVTKGSFKMGPVGADAMYHGDYHSYNGGGSIRITDK